MIQVNNPYPQFFDADGDPLDNGKVYFGVKNLDPRTNPKAVYSDYAGTTPVTQPVRTQNGYLVNGAGSPIAVYVDGDHSIAAYTSADVLLWSAPDSSQYNIESRATSAISLVADEIIDDLALGSGSSTIGFVQNGTGAVNSTVQAQLREEVHTKQFGAIHDGVADDADAINAAIAYAATLKSPKLVIDRGDTFCSKPLNFSVSSGTHIEFLGKIISSVAGASAVRIGSPSAMTRSLTVTGLKVERTAVDTNLLSVGVQLRNLVFCNIDIRQCINFQDGVLLYADQANGGISYNEITLGYLHDNKINVHLSAGGVGYCNENNFYGGGFNHSSSYPAVETVNLQIDHFPTNPLNNNRFYSPSFEDNSVLSIAASINGTNYIYKPRIENPANQDNYPIRLEAESNYCEIEADSFACQQSNIVDLGFANSYETKNGSFIKKSTSTGAGEAVLSLQSVATSSAKMLSFVDSGGNETGWVKGDGSASYKSFHITNLGNYANDAAAAIGGVPINGIYRNGSVLMIRVS